MDDNENIHVSTVLDANGQMPSSMSTNMVTSLGGFNQCMAIRSNENIYGKYCLLTLKIKTSLARTKTDKPIDFDQIEQQIQSLRTITSKYPLTLGLCFPHVCTSEEMNSLLNNCKLLQKDIIEANILIKIWLIGCLK